MLQTLSDALWRPWMLGAFLFTGLWCSLSGGFFQLFGLKSWLKESLGALRGGKKEGKTGELSPFQALCTALASTMGTGSIAGVATAITLGGAGAVLWMWVVAVLGMMTGYVEKFLAVRHRRRGPTGWEGGPIEYLSHLGWRLAGGWYALWCALSALTGGALVQTNSMVSCLPGLGPAGRWGAGGLIALTVAWVMAGGLKGLGKLSQALVPAMAGLYLTAGVAVICHNAVALPAALAAIFRGALSPQALAGGAAGAALRYGVARGVFTNEAGIGSSAMAHAAADAKSPASEGFWGMLEVCLATLVICTVTALCILTTGVYDPAAALEAIRAGTVTGAMTGAPLTAAAFATVFGRGGPAIVAVCLFLFAFTSLLGWGYYGERGLSCLTGEEGLKGPFRLLFLTAIVLGSVGGVGQVWALSDICNGLMALPNLLALAVLAPEAWRELKK